MLSSTAATTSEALNWRRMTARAAGCVFVETKEKPDVPAERGHVGLESKPTSNLSVEGKRSNHWV